MYYAMVNLGEGDISIHVPTRGTTKKGQKIMIKKRTPEMGRPTLYEGVKMKDTALRLRPDQTAWLIEEAARRGISKAQLVRDLIDAEMERINAR